MIQTVQSYETSETKLPISRVDYGVSYPKINDQNIPLGFAEVDAEVDDNGEKIDTTLVAGSVGSQSCVGTDFARNTIRPLPAWWYTIMQ